MTTTLPPSTRKTAHSVAWLAGSLAAAGAVAAYCLGRPDWPREAGLMAGIFVLAALLWATEALPLFATSLLVLGLEVILLANPGEWAGLGYEARKSPPFQEFIHAAADPVLLLFFGGFLLARAAVKEGVDRAMSSLLLAPFGQRAPWVLLGVMAVTALFSMWMSNTATTAMMITLVAPMVAQLPPGERFRRGLILAVPVAANLGGLGTPIASPPNAVAAGFLRTAGHPVSFLEWMLVGVPLMAGLLVLAWWLLWRLFRPSHKTQIAPQRETLLARGWYVAGVFTVTVLLWLSEPWHGLPTAVVALLPAVALTAPGIIDRDDLNQIPWNVLILIGGGIALGAGMQKTGLDAILVQSLPTGSGSLWLLPVLVLATIAIGTFMSNTAAANLLLPIGISAAGAAAGGPFAVQVAVSIALAASMSMALPISTPPNAIAYATGEITTRDLALVGVIVGITGAVLIILLSGPVMRFWGITR